MTWTVFRCVIDLVEYVHARDYLSDVLISLDHDLGHMDEKTGMDAIKGIVDDLLDRNLTRVAELPTVIVHSQNPVGARNIEAYWNNFVNTLR